MSTDDNVIREGGIFEPAPVHEKPAIKTITTGGTFGSGTGTDNEVQGVKDFTNIQTSGIFEPDDATPPPPPEPVVTPPPPPAPEPVVAPAPVVVNEAITATKKKVDKNKPIAPKEIDPLKPISDDFLTSSSKFFQDLQDPNIPDPIKTAQMNEFITSFGSQNQALTDSMMLQLKQQGKEGSGAGNALMFNMARGNNADYSNMMAKLNTQSAQRIFDANKYGMEKGIQLRQQLNAETQEKFRTDGLLFASAVEAGDFEEVARLGNELGLQNLDTTKMEAMSDLEMANFAARSLVDLGFTPEAVNQFSGITGIELDANDIAVLDPARQGLIQARLSSIEKITNPEEKAAAMSELAAEFPEAFGFAGDASAAQNFVDNIDYNDIEANANNQSAANDFWQSESVKSSPNMNGVIEVGRKFFESYTDASIDSQYKTVADKFNSLDAEGKADALAGMDQFGVNSMSDIDTIEEKKAFLSVNKFNNKKKNIASVATEMFTSFGQVTAGTSMADWFDGTDETKSDVAREWIADIIIGGNYETDANGNIVPNLGDIIPPWKDNSNQYTFMTWPRKYDANGNALTGSDVYQGKEFRDDLGSDSVHSDPAAISEDQELTRKYMQFKKDNPDSGSSWLQWYDESKGGTQRVFKKTNLNSSLSSEELNAVSSFDSSLSTGDFSSMTPEEQVLAFKSDPSLLERMKASNSIEKLSLSGGGIKQPKDNTWNSVEGSGFKFDTVAFAEGGSSRATTHADKGAGDGKGTIAIVDGAAYRFIAYRGDLKTGEGKIMAKPLDGGNPIWLEWIPE